MATYNRGSLISQTLDSIRNQSFENWKCYIIDDGSVDQTEEICRQYQEHDYRIKYFKRPNGYKKGISGSRNFGIDIASGDYIIFFDDDDIVHPLNLEICLKQVKAKDGRFCRFEKKPFITICVPELPGEIESSNFTIDDLPKMIKGEEAFASCCVLWERSVFDNVRFNEELQYAEEWECYSRILASGVSGVSVKNVLYYNRKHSNSNTGEFRQKKPLRVNSQIDAAILILKNFKAINYKSPELKKFFLRMGFDLGSKDLIKETLEWTDSGKLEKVKFLLGFEIYPLLKPIFYLKAQIKTL